MAEKVSKADKKAIRDEFVAELESQAGQPAAPLPPDPRAAFLSHFKQIHKDRMEKVGLRTIRRWYATYVVELCAASPPGTKGHAMYRQHQRHMAGLVSGEDDGNAIHHDFLSYEDAASGEGQEEDDDDEMEVDRPITFQVGIECVNRLAGALDRVARVGYGSTAPDGLLDEVRGVIGYIQPWPDLLGTLDTITQTVECVFLEMRAVPLKDVPLQEGDQPLDPSEAQHVLARSINVDVEVYTEYHQTLIEAMHATQSGLQQLVGKTRSAIGKIKNGCLMESVKATPKRVLTCVKLVHNALQGSAAYHSGMANAQKAERERKRRRAAQEAEEARLQRLLELLQRLNLFITSVLEGEVEAGRRAMQRACREKSARCAELQRILDARKREVDDWLSRSMDMATIG